ncbi:MAG: hypothetical protein AB7D06_14925 [Pedobacter sp.]
MTDERDRNAKIKDILPILWNSYEHIYEVRETSTTSSINYLMIIATFLPLFCLTLYGAFKIVLFIIPILFQIIALLILLKRFSIKGSLPWFELKEILSQLDKNDFEAAFLAELKAAEDDTWRCLVEYRTIIKRALFLLVFSIFLIALASVFMIMNGSTQLYVVTVMLLVVFLLLYFFYNEVPESKFNSDKEKYKDEIKKWLYKCEGLSDAGPGSTPK